MCKLWACPIYTWNNDSENVHAFETHWDFKHEEVIPWPTFGASRFATTYCKWVPKTKMTCNDLILFIISSLKVIIYCFEKPSSILSFVEIVKIMLSHTLSCFLFILYKKIYYHFLRSQNVLWNQIRTINTICDCK